MKPRSISFRPEAQAELLEARDWYDHESPGLGAELVAAIEGIVDQILDNPLAFPRIQGETRRALLHRFPYAVYFRVTASEIVVLGVFHGRQRPRDWRRSGR